MQWRTRHRLLRAAQLAVPVALVLGLLAGRAWLKSEDASTVLRRMVLEALGTALAGRVELGALQVSGNRLELRELRLFSPEGELVAEVDRAEGTFDVSRLRPSSVVLTDVELHSPRFHLLRDERGFNLARALAPPQARQGVEGSAFRLEVQRLSLTRGRVELRDGERHLLVENISGNGDAELEFKPLQLEGELRLTGEVRAPLDAPFEGRLSARSPTPGHLELAVATSVGASRADGRFSVSTSELRAAEVVAAPELMQVLVEGWPLRVPVTASGVLSPAGAQLTLTAGRATVEVKGSLSDVRLDSLTGDVGVKGSWLPGAGGATPRVTFSARASATAGAVSILRVEAAAPGLNIEVAGRATRQELDLSGRLDATDLSALSDIVVALTNRPVTLEGRGQLQLGVTGTPRRPGVWARGALEHLRIGPMWVDSLRTDAQIPNVRSPHDVAASLVAQRVRWNGAKLEEATARLSTRGRQFQASLSSRGLGDMEVALSGFLLPSSDALSIDSADVRGHGFSWSLSAPTRLRWSESSLDLAPLTLRSGAQRVIVAARTSGTRLVGTLELEGLDLGRLPPVLSPSGHTLGGLVDARVGASGRWPSPDLAVSGRWREGRWEELRVVEASVDATLKANRLAGTLTLASSAGSGRVVVDLPTDEWSPRRESPWSVQASLGDVDLVALARLGGLAPHLRGLAQLEMKLSGTTKRPDLQATLSSPRLALNLGQLQAGVLEMEEVTLTTSTHLGGTLGAVFSGRALGGAVAVGVRSGLTIPGLRAAPPRVEELSGLPLQGEVELRSLDLSALHSLGLFNGESLRGRGSLTAALSGCGAAPRGEATLTLADASGFGVKELGLAVTVRGDEERSAVLAKAELAGRPAFAGEATLAGPPETLSDPERVSSLALSLTGSLFPTQLALASVGGPGARGVASGTVHAAGTLNRPAVAVRGVVNSLAFGSRPVGDLRLDWKSGATPREQRVRLALETAEREDLAVEGTVGVDLSLGALRRGLPGGETPLNLRASATALDVSFLSGLHPLVPAVGGELTLAGTVTGTVGAPRFLGDATWSRGRLGLVGYGESRDIELAMQASNDLVEVRRLQAHSAGGALSLRATARRQSAASFRLSAEATTDQFPIVVNDQLVARLSSEAAIEGELSDDRVHLSNLEFTRAVVDLPQAERRSVQSLQAPSDVVFRRSGRRPTADPKPPTATQPREGPVRVGRVYSAVLNAPRNLWVKSNDLNIELGLSEGFTVELAPTSTSRTSQVHVSGQAWVQRGTMNVLGREFDVQGVASRADAFGDRRESSSLRFEGPATEPLVNVVATHSNSREKVKVTVRVVGKGSAVTLKASSEPPLPESDVLTLLATGRLELKRGAASSITPGQAASAVGNVAFSQLKKALRSKLPIDVFNFEPGETLESMGLDAGKYLSNSVYLGYSWKPDAREDRGENKHSGRLEFQFSRHWALEVTAGTAPSAGVDLMWSRDF